MFVGEDANLHFYCGLRSGYDEIDTYVQFLELLRTDGARGIHQQFFTFWFHRKHNHFTDVALIGEGAGAPPMRSIPGAIPP